MKTKTFLLLCLIFGIGLTHLSAQNGKNGTGTVIQEGNFPDWYVPVYCDGVLSDWLYFPSLDVKWWVHYKDGVMISGNNKCESTEGIMVSTGEVYKVEASFDHWSDVRGYIYSQFHLIGNKGGNITFLIKTDLTTMEILVVHSNCR